MIAAQQSGLRRAARIVTVSVPDVLDSRRPDLDRAAEAVRNQLGGSLRDGAVFGAGAGALAALRLAGLPGVQVRWLALMVGPRARPSPVRAVWPAARRLLPVAALPRLGVGAAEIWPALDQVRPVDYRGALARVSCPAFVVCGADDAASRPGSAQLAKRLPRGELRLVPGAGPGWAESQPQRLGEVLRQLFDAAS